MERSCLMSWSGVQVTAFPKHNAFDSSGFLCLGDPPLPFLPQTTQGQAMETASARAHKQTTAQATIQEAPKAHVSRKTRVRHMLEESSGMHTDGHELLQINSPKKPINRVCSCEESTDEPKQSETSTTGQGRLRWGFKRHQGKGGNVKSTWPGCEVKPVGDLSPLQYYSHSPHTHPWTEVVIANS